MKEVVSLEYADALERQRDDYRNRWDVAVKRIAALEAQDAPAVYDLTKVCGREVLKVVDGYADAKDPDWWFDSGYYGEFVRVHPYEHDGPDAVTVLILRGEEKT